MVSKLKKDNAFSIGVIPGLKTIILNKYGLPLEQKTNVYQDYLDIFSYNKEEENKENDNTNNMTNIIDTTPNKDSEIVSKFSSGEVIGKGGDFNSNTPNTFLVNNNELSNNLQKQINNITNLYAFFTLSL